MANKRDLKSAPYDREESRRRKKRIAEVIKTVQESDPTLNPKLLRDAISWSERYLKECRVKGIAYPFPDTLKVLEYLVAEKPPHIDQVKINANAIIAAALFPYVSPAPGKDFDRHALENVGRTFGTRIRDIVLGAVRMNSFQVLPLKEGHTQTQEEQFELAREAALSLANPSEVVLVRGAYRTVMLMDEFENAAQKTVDKATRDRELKEIANVVAPVAYRAGYEFLRYDLLDWVYRLQDPDGYKRIQEEAAGMEPVTLNELNKAKRILLDEAEKTLVERYGIHHFEAPHLLEGQVREKSVASKAEKAARKKQTIDQLGDGLGARIILDDKIGQPEDYNFDDLSPKGQSEHLVNLGEISLAIYHDLSHKFGRHSNDPELGDFFRFLAVLDPHETIVGLDARFDNYIHEPKKLSEAGKKLGRLPFGWSAVQDTLVVCVPSDADPTIMKRVVIEYQGSDKLRMDNNKKHPLVGYETYKTGMVQKYSNAVIVYDALHQLVKLSSEAKARHFAKVQGFEQPDGTSYFVENLDPTARRVRGVPYASTLPLMTGDQISTTPPKAPGLSL